MAGGPCDVLHCPHAPSQRPPTGQRISRHCCQPQRGPPPENNMSPGARALDACPLGHITRGPTCPPPLLCKNIRNSNGNEGFMSTSAKIKRESGTANARAGSRTLSGSKKQARLALTRRRGGERERERKSKQGKSEWDKKLAVNKQGANATRQ